MKVGRDGVILLHPTFLTTFERSESWNLDPETSLSVDLFLHRSLNTNVVDPWIYDGIPLLVIDFQKEA
jgi:hypothetical protein